MRKLYIIHMLLLHGLGDFNSLKFKSKAVAQLQFCLDSFSAHLLHTIPGKAVKRCCCDRTNICPSEFILTSLFCGVFFLNNFSILISGVSVWKPSKSLAPEGSYVNSVLVRAVRWICNMTICTFTCKFSSRDAWFRADLKEFTVKTKPWFYVAVSLLLFYYWGRN